MENAFCALVIIFVRFGYLASGVDVILDRYCWMVIVLVMGSFVVLVLGGKYFLLVIRLEICVAFVGIALIGVVVVVVHVCFCICYCIF